MESHSQEDKKLAPVIETAEYIVPAKTKGVKSKNDCAQHKWATRHLDNMFFDGQFGKRSELEKLYQYAEARVDEALLTRVTGIYSKGSGGIEKVIPAEIRQVNRIPTILNRLIGEAWTQPIKYAVTATNADAVVSKLEKFVAEASEKVARMVRQQSGIDKILGDKLYEEDEQLVLPQEVEEMNFSTYREADEIMMQDALNYLMSKTSNSNIRYKLTNQNYRDYLICNEMASQIYIDLDDPNFDRIDPRDLGYILSPNSPFIHHGQAAWRYIVDTPMGFINRFPDLPKEDVENLQTMHNLFVDGKIHVNNIFEKTGCNGFISERNGYRALYISAMFGTWRASKRLRVKISENKFDADNPHIHFVDDSDNSASSKYEHRYIEEIWEGYKIGSIYHRVRPRPGQNMAGDNIREKDLSIIGIVDPNPSIVRLVQPFEELRMEAFFNVERLMNQIQGNVLIFDEAIESDNADNVYNMRASGLWKINTAKEGDMQIGTGNKQAMKPDVKDMSGSMALTQLMNFITFLDMNVMMITGINDARQGITKPDAGLGVMQNANMASQMTTQPYLTTWYTMCQIILQKLLEELKPAWSGKEVTRYFLGDAGYELLQVKPGDWDANVYGVFVENAANSDFMKSKIIAIAEKVLPVSSDPELALAIIKMQNSNNPNEAIRIFEKGVETIKKLQEQSRQDALNAQQQNLQAMSEKEQAKMQVENNKVQGGIQEATIAAQAKLKDTEMKLEAKGELTDVQKQNKIDEKMVDHELSKNRQ